MKAALRPALPLLIGIALAAVLALVAMHSLAFGTSAAIVGSHHSVGYATEAAYDTDHQADLAVPDHDTATADAHDHDHGAATIDAHDHGTETVDAHAHAHAHDTATADAHDHGASAVCASSDGAECCSWVANASGAPTITLHAFPGTVVPALAESTPVASLFATEAAERPPSRALLSVIRV